MFKRVISYGCSLTAGGELIDHLITPHAEEIKRIHGLRYFIQMFLEERFRKIKKQNELSWPGKIAKKLEVSLCFRAKGGSSLQEQVFHLQKDFENPTFFDGSLVVFGVPSWKRDCTFDKFGDPVSYIDRDPKENMIWNYLNYLNSLSTISEQIGENFKVFVFKPPPLENPVFKTMFEKIISKDTFYTASIYDFVKDDSEMLAGGHPNETVHDRFADYILSQIL